jgi:hypothetical protein
MKAYRIGRSVVLPHVRFINHGAQKNMVMFHSDIIRINGKHKTLGCNRMDDSGFCLGHEISRKEFLEKYCGMETDTVEETDEDGVPSLGNNLSRN